MTRIKLKVLLALGFALGALAIGTSAAVPMQQAIRPLHPPRRPGLPRGHRLPGVHGRLLREQHPRRHYPAGQRRTPEAEVFIPGGTDVLSGLAA